MRNPWRFRQGYILALWVAKKPGKCAIDGLNAFRHEEVVPVSTSGFTPDYAVIDKLTDVLAYLRLIYGLVECSAACCAPDGKYDICDTSVLAAFMGLPEYVKNEAGSWFDGITAQLGGVLEFCHIDKLG